MGRGDRRKSLKMRRRKAQRALKLRGKKKREATKADRAAGKSPSGDEG